MSAYGPNSYYAQNLKMGRKGNDMGSGSAWDNPGGRQQLTGAPWNKPMQQMQPQQKQGGGGIFGGLKSAFGGMFGGGGNKFNPMMNQSKFNPMNMPGLSQARNTMFGKPGGIGPSMNQGSWNNMAQGAANVAGQMGMGGMKPPQMDGGGWQQMPGMDKGIKASYQGPMMQPGEAMQNGTIGGIGPSMDAMNQMLQQPEQSQQPAAAGPMPDFMNKFGGQPLNRGYGRM